MQNTATSTSIRLSFDRAKTIRRHSGRRRDAEYHTAYSPTLRREREDPVWTYEPELDGRSEMKPIGRFG